MLPTETERYLGVLGYGGRTLWVALGRATLDNGRPDALGARAARTALRARLGARLDFAGLVPPARHHGLQLLSRRRGEQCTVTCEQIAVYPRDKAIMPERTS